jgi:hypothetical protein
MECFVYNWRNLLGGAASAAILTVGIAAPAFAQAQDAPVSLRGLNSASGVLCGLALPVPGVAAAANVLGASCGTGSSTGLGSVTGTLSGVTGGLQNGGSITTPLSGVNGG